MYAAMLPDDEIRHRRLTINIPNQTYALVKRQQMLYKWSQSFETNVKRTPHQFLQAIGAASSIGVATKVDAALISVSVYQLCGAS